MPLATISETAKILGYKSRSQLYKMKADGWIDPYVIEIRGRTYLDLYPTGHEPLDTHIMGIIQWRPSNPTREINHSLVETL